MIIVYHFWLIYWSTNHGRKMSNNVGGFLTLQVPIMVDNNLSFTYLLLITHSVILYFWFFKNSLFSNLVMILVATRRM